MRPGDLPGRFVESNQVERRPVLLISDERHRSAGNRQRYASIIAPYQLNKHLKKSFDFSASR